MNVASSKIDGSRDDWHKKLTERIEALDKRGSGTLESGDGVYEIPEPPRLAKGRLKGTFDIIR